MNRHFVGSSICKEGEKFFPSCLDKIVEIVAISDGNFAIVLSVIKSDPNFNFFRIHVVS